LAGFASGEGCFRVLLIKSKTCKVGYNVVLDFSLVQHIRDENLLKSLIGYLNCGKISYQNKAVYFRVWKFDDIFNIIIPFFKKNQIMGVKYKDFND
jgi:hypothetical protein